MKKFLTIAIALCLATTAFAQVINTVIVTITPPVAGQHPNLTSTPGHSTYTTQVGGWRIQGSSTAMTEKDVFVAGTTYEVTVRFTPTAGNSFAPTASLAVTINGQVAKFEMAGAGSVFYTTSFVATAAACEHETTSTELTTPPSCTEDGEETTSCNDCGITISTKPILAWGHNWGSWSVTTPPTETEEGVETRHCQRPLCIAFETRPIPATGTSPFAGGDGSAENPYQITTAAQLAQLATLVNAEDILYNAAHYKLMNNIDLSEYGETFNGGRGWIPIGYVNNSGLNKPFKGVFDGNQNVITGLYINTTQMMVGLFASVVDGSIINLGVENADITGHWYVGGIVCRMADGIISNCYITGTVIGTFDSWTVVGAIAGEIGGNSLITNCYSTATVSGAGALVGGIVANAYDESSVSNCWATGAVSGTNSVGGIANVGNVSNSAALNSKIMATGTIFGRVTSSTTGYSLSNNVAFNRMLNQSDQTDWYHIGATFLDGANISTSVIHADGTLGGRFTPENGWTIENGKLPGLFGNTVDMPAHLLAIEVCEHKNISTAITTPAMCTADGIETATCVDCGEFLGTEPIPATGHINTTTVVITAATCTADGEGSVTCDDCGEDLGISAIPATGHTATWIEPIPPTCTTDGGYYLTCTICGEVLDTNPNIAFGHNWGAWTITLPATALENGEETRYCTRTDCDAFETRPIPATGAFLAGDGSAGNPFQITAAVQLRNMANLVNAGDIVYNSAHYKLMNNIDLSAYGEDFENTVFGGRGWTPIGNNQNNMMRFFGVFDGNQKIITGLYINRTDGWASDYLGLFGYVEDGTIINLGLENVNIMGRNFVGGIAGNLHNSTVTQCYVTGIVGGTQSYVGGIVGGAGYSSIAHCYSTATVSGGSTLIGGIIGLGDWATEISHCWSSGTVVGKVGESVGGIAGGLWRDGSVMQSCAALNMGFASGRVVPNYGIGASLSNNIGLDSMFHQSGPTEWYVDVNGGSGDDISIPEIHADGTLGGRFTTANGWTVENGKLPGLFGTAVNMPPHLSNTPVAPVIVTATLPNSKEGEVYSVTLFATGTNPISWSVVGAGLTSTLPDGLSLSGAVISGTPTTAGIFNFTIKAENSVGSITKDFSITIAETTIPPVITTESVYLATLGVPYNFTLQATGTAPITWQLVGGSSIAGITLSSSGVLSGTPTAIGTFNFTVRATNPVGNVTKVLSITISAATCTHENTTGATCTVDGICTICGEVVEKAFGHTAGNWVETLAATCIADGEETLFCKVCDEEMDWDIIPALGHTFGSWTVTKPATDTAEGVETRYCIRENCDHSETQPIPKTTSMVDLLETNILRVYPNPTTGQLTIDNGASTPLSTRTLNEIEVFDIYGKRINNSQLSILNSQLDISRLPAGTYFLRISDKTVKVVKQ